MNGPAIKDKQLPLGANGLIYLDRRLPVVGASTGPADGEPRELTDRILPAGLDHGDLCARRPAAQRIQQLIELRARSFSDHFNRPIPPVADPACHGQLAGGPLHEIPEPYALDAPFKMDVQTGKFSFGHSELLCWIKEARRQCERVCLG
jgi:hypothetical protein